MKYYRDIKSECVLCSFFVIHKWIQAPKNRKIGTYLSKNGDREISSDYDRPGFYTLINYRLEALGTIQVFE